MSNERTPSKQDRDYAAAKRRRDLSKPRPEDLARSLRSEAAGPLARPAGKTPLCPDTQCGSTAWMDWDGRRGYWIHERCGLTATPEELAEIDLTRGDA